MAEFRGQGSRDAPIDLEDDDFVPPQILPTVKERCRQTLDEDGFEEIVEQANNGAPPARSAAAENERRHSGGNWRSSGPFSVNRGANAARDIGQTPAAKPTAYIDLCSGEDEPAPAPVTQQHVDAPMLQAAKASTPSAEKPSINSVPQRQSPTEPSDLINAPVKVATPPVQPSYHSPHSPRLPDSKIQKASPEVRETTTTTTTATTTTTSSSSSSRMAALLGYNDSSPPAPSLEPEPTFSVLNQPTEPAPEHPESSKQINASADRERSGYESARSTPGLGLHTSSVRHDGRGSPIGDFADRNRERATSSRVNTPLQRASAATEANKTSMAFLMPTKARKSCIPAVAKVQQKQKAIKSVKRSQPPAKDRNAVSDEIGRSEPSHSHFRSPNREASLAYANVAANIKSRLTERPKYPDVNMPKQPPTTEVAHDAQAHPLMRINCTSSSSPFTAVPLVQSSIEASREINRDVQVPSPTLFAQNDDQIAMALQVQVDEPVAVRSAIDLCLTRHLEIRHEAHAYLMWSKLMRQRTCQEQELRTRARSKEKRPAPSTVPDRYIQHVSPFESMPPVQAPWNKNTSNRGLPDITQEVYIKANPKDTVIKTALFVTPTKYKSDAVKIPPFKEYVSLRNNILADNETKLLATPYFQDGDYTGRQALMKALPYMYEMTHDENGPLDLRKEQCRFYKDSIEAFLTEIGVAWNDVLYWLLASDEMLTRTNNTSPGSELFEAVVLERSRYHIEEFKRDEELKKAELFNRSSKKWRAFLPQLQQPTAGALRLAATACAAILQECEFSVWYLAQQSELVQDHISRKTQTGQTTKRSTYREMMCGVCHQHNCLLHGELREVPEDSWKTESEDEHEHEPQELEDQFGDGDERRESKQHTEDEPSFEDGAEDGPLPAHFHDDSDVEKVINYKLPANSEAFKVCGESEMIHSKGAKPPAGKFNSNWWIQRDLTHHWEKRKPFFPCSHDGTCEDAQCRCFREGINCEKTCKCPSLCNRRYPGCTCAAIPGRRICGTAACLCVKFNRECDADLCGSCGATEVLDPVNRYDNEVLEANCCNVAIQRGVPRKTLLGHSEVHGFGLYMGEDIKSGEYIGEYTGEVISTSEGNRRVTIYDYQKTMYLFSLNSKQEVDATYMGNKLRFINNADDKYTNCCPKNLLCNTVFRIALFATTDIKAGIELYFNYNYPKEKTAQFKQPNAKVVAVKQVKQKAKRKELLNDSQAVSPRVLAATAKARAAKAAKKALLEQHFSQVSAASRRPGPLQARKAATSKPGRKKAPMGRVRKSVLDTESRNESYASDSGMDAKASDNDSPAMGESQDTQTMVSTQFIPDSDEEDDDFIMPDTQEEEDDFDIPFSNAEENTVVEGTPKLRGPGRPHKRTSGVAPVVAVKKGKKRGGARPGTGRKRKRSLVVNSDDE